MVAELEIPTLSTNNVDKDDYHSAITGVSAFSPGANPDTTDTNSNIDTNDGNYFSAEMNNGLSEPMIKSGIGGASANLVNSIVGAGIIGIPYAFKQSGLVAGVLLLILVAFLTEKSLRIIIGLASFHPLLHNRKVQTFEDLAAYPFGAYGSKFILFNMFVCAYGAMIAYLLIIKDTIPSILGVAEEGNYIIRNSIMTGTSILIMVPLSLQRDMASLAITSLFSVTADVFLVIFIASFAPIKESIENNGGLATVLRNDSFNQSLFIGLGILSTAMACQHSAFIVSGSLENKTMRRWATVTGGSITIAAILCLILGTTGYLGYLGDTKGDVLNNFDKDLTIAKLARVLLAITMFCTYPMESFVARHVLIMLFHGGDMDGKDDPNYVQGVVGAEAGGLFCLNRRQTYTWGIYVLTLIPALLFEDIGPVLSITGSVGGGSISYLAPGLVYLGVNGDAFLSFASSLLQKRPATTNGNVDGGQMSPTTATLDLPIEGTRVISTVVPEDISTKPIWWYLAGFPVWCAVATIGRTNMRRKIAEEDGGFDRGGGEDAHGSYQAHSTPPITHNVNVSTETERSDFLMVPNMRDYFVAVFFILFGMLSIVAGLTSNIWMIIKGDDDNSYDNEDASANADYYENE